MSVSKESASLEEQVRNLRRATAVAQSQLQKLRDALRVARTEERRASETLRDVLYGSGIATILVNQDLEIEFFTPVAVTMFRMLSSDIGHPIGELSLIAIDTELESDVRDILACQGGERFRTVKGQGKCFSRRMLPRWSQDRQVNGVIVSYIELTAIGADDGDVAPVVHEQTQAVIELLQTPIAILDRDGRTVLANDRFRDTVAVNPHLLQLAGDEIRDRLHHDADVLETLSAAGVLHEEIDMASATAAGRRVRFHAATLPANGGNGASPMHLVFADDWQSDLDTARSPVDIQPRWRDLRHDLFQPLQTLRMLRATMPDDTLGQGDPGRRQRLDEAVEALAGMLNSIVTLEGLQAGWLAVCPDKDIEIGQIIDRLHLEFGYQAAIRGLEWDVVECPAQVRTDPQLLEYLIRGIVVRALRGIGSGSFLLKCQSTPSHVRVELWNRDSSVGHALPLHSMFDASSAAAGDLYPLDLLNHLAEQLSVDLEFRDRQDDGPVCVLHIPAAHSRLSARSVPETRPVAEPDQTLPNPPDDARANRSDGELVAVVDDDNNFLRSVKHALHSVGIAARTFSAVDQFLEGYDRSSTHCLIVDAKMPDRDGFSLIAQLRSLDPGLPFIMITGAGDVETAVRAMKFGASDFIEKPVSIQRLVESIQRALNGRGKAEDSQPADVVQPGGDLDLTPRQAEVLDFIVEGLANKEIAARLQISERTVENHRAALRRRTGAKTLSDLIRLRLSR